MESLQVNVLGWFNHGNIGDEAYKIAFPTLFPQHTFNFLEKLSTPVDNCILGGGDVVGGYFLDQIKNAKRKIALSVTANENQTLDQLKQFDKIYVRDPFSVNYCQKVGITPSLIPDLTFCLTPNKEHGSELLTKMFSNNKIDKYQRIIGVCINANIAPSNNCSAQDYARFEQFCYDLADVLDNYNASFVFIPFSNRMPYDDRISNGMVASRCKFWKKNLVIFDELTVQDTLDIVSACNEMISTRLHSSIFSCLGNVPFIDILHNHKNRSFLDAIMYKTCLEYRDFSKHDLVKCLNKIGLEERELHVNMLRAIANEQKNSLTEIVKNVHLL